MPDLLALTHRVAEQLADLPENATITDQCARDIARLWTADRPSALSDLARTGRITDDTRYALDQVDTAALAADRAAEWRALRTYVDHHGERGPRWTATGQPVGGTAREQVLAAATAHGWRVHHQPAEGWTGQHELRRTRRHGGRQRTEYVTFSCDVLDRIVWVTWSPGMDGINARSPRNHKLAWTLRKLSDR
jgi:hypothetical protein